MTIHTHRSSQAFKIKGQSTDRCPSYSWLDISLWSSSWWGFSARFFSRIYMDPWGPHPSWQYSLYACTSSAWSQASVNWYAYRIRLSCLPLRTSDVKTSTWKNIRSQPDPARIFPPHSFDTKHEWIPWTRWSTPSLIRWLHHGTFTDIISQSPAITGTRIYKLNYFLGHEHGILLHDNRCCFFKDDWVKPICWLWFEILLLTVKE